MARPEGEKGYAIETCGYAHRKSLRKKFMWPDAGQDQLRVTRSYGENGQMEGWEMSKCSSPLGLCKVLEL